MRTRLTLDDDAATKVRDEMARTGRTLKEVVNATLRSGFEAPGEEELVRPFSVEARPMGLGTGFDVNDISGLLDHLDGPTSR